MKLTYRLFPLLLLLWLNISLQAQRSFGGQPLGLSQDLGDRPTLELPAPNLNKVRQADKANGNNPRFAVPVATDAGLEQTGNWTELPDGGRVWQMQLQSPGALGLAVIYDDFFLPAGARLFMYSPDGRQLKGAYTFQNNRKSRQFFTGFIRGNRAVLEYYEPAGQRGRGRLHFSRVDYAYNKQEFRNSQQPPQGNPAASFGYGTSLGCHTNANCPDDDEWEAAKRGVCRIVMVLEEGTGYCSGSLINNTAEDETPYILSASHCQMNFTPLHDLWRFDFEYEASGCNDPAQEPGSNSLLGCVQRAERFESDFLLLEITAPLPLSYNLYFNGWDRSGDAPASGNLYHHPSGDIKKRSVYTQPSVVYNTGIDWTDSDGDVVTTPANHHFQVDYSEGTFEVGSSGSPLFGPDQRIHGQLHGGIHDCSLVTIGYYGRLSRSWADGSSTDSRLNDWLDPLGLGVETLDGKEQQQQGSFSISGQVTNELGTPIVNAEVHISGPVTDSVTTGEDGQYAFNDIPLGNAVGLRVEKTDAATAGVSLADQILIAKHSLAVDTLDSVYKMLAADVNDSGNISVLDRIQIQKIILGINLQFEGQPAWRFLPASWPLGDDPFANHPLPEIFLLDDITGNLSGFDFIGVKLGDVNLNSPTDN